jgi:NADH-quinone oxidoreductase subunit J
VTVLFYIAGVVALIASLMVITRKHAVHAALYLVVSLLGVAVVFFTLGAAFLGVLEIIVYAGAIMVLIVFVIMLLDLGSEAARQESQWLRPASWIGPALLALVLLAELVIVLTGGVEHAAGSSRVEARQVALSLFGPYVLGVELASMLLLAGLVGAYHLGVAAREGDEP